jgi:hypothetical protein
MNSLVDIATTVLLVAGITVLVRPGSQGPAFVSGTEQGFASIVSAATSFGTA